MPSIRGGLPLQAPERIHDFQRHGVPGERIQPDDISTRLPQNNRAQLAVLLDKVGGTLKAAPREHVFDFALRQLAQRRRRAYQVGFRKLAFGNNPE